MSKAPSTAATRLLREKGVVFMERSILALPAVYANGGSRGFLVRLDPREMVRLLAPTLVEVGIAAE